MNKILIIGGGGYIGTTLVSSLIERGESVTVLDLFWFGNHLHEGTTVIKKDAADMTVDDFKGYEKVIFLAGLSNDPMAEFDPRTNFYSNGPLPVYTAYLAKEAGVKTYVYASSASIYGFASKDCYETSDALPRSFYGISKLQGETGCLCLADENFTVIALRQGTVSGYSPRMRYDLLLNTMYMTAATKDEINVRNPAIWRPILFINDAVNCFIHALSLKESGIINVASFNTTLAECAISIQELFRKKHDKHIPINTEQIEDPRNYRMNIDKALSLGFTFTADIKEVVENIDESVGLNADFDKDEGYNIRVFKKL